MKHLHRKKQEVTFRSFLFKPIHPYFFGEIIIQQYFTGLREHIDWGHLATGNRVSGAGQDGEILSPYDSPVIDPLRPVYKTVGHYLDTSHALFKTRMSQELQHVSMIYTKLTTKNKGNRTRREHLRCVLCCYKCAGSENCAPHSREGQTTTKFCLMCKVSLCKNFFKCFHEMEKPPLPPCSLYNNVLSIIVTRACQGSTGTVGLVVVADRRRGRCTQQNHGEESKEEAAEEKPTIQEEESKEEEASAESEGEEPAIEKR